MKTVDLVIIGGGPAGLATAVKAHELGVKDILILERDIQLGGILQQCIHDGFGLHRFGKQLSGSSYAQKFIDKVEEYNIPVMCNTMVLDVSADKKIVAVNPEMGLIEIEAKAIVLAMGCRERTRPQVRILGTRPAGVMTAGAVQRYINVEGWKTGTRAVILGSGDIGLIMARRMTLEGVSVEGVYEVMPNLGGLRRNKAQCLDDYNIPLHLATTVVSVHGKKRVEGVTVAKVGPDRLPVPGTERYIACDLLVLSVGLIPENELSRTAGIALHPITKGPVVDSSMMSSAEGIFVAGNVGAVFDLVDYVSATGEVAAAGATTYLEEKRVASVEKDVIAGEQVSFVFPQKLHIDPQQEKATVYLRVRSTMRKVKLEVVSGDEVIVTKRENFVTPPEMVSVEIPLDKVDTMKDLSIRVVE
ncbi:NAD(P)/FAD-dependent oxidoreductase [Chakrabartyella piscis]|uniref:NAD(P)/FAD-dependent oxidoreductase n=1 Tax=Chakrabartyella piscis TaxID=2918914 RepID=UPI002958BCAA|nr:FAD-dependent oxidoreductase [Chakrabartyella piscis]